MSNQTRVAPSSVTRPWRKCFAENYAGSFPAVNPDLVAAQSGGRPAMAAGQALIDFGSQIVPEKVHLLLFGAGNANQTVKARVWGFRACAGGFIGTLLWAGTGTLCDTTGTAGFDVADTDRYCDAISTTVGTESVDCRTLSPGGELPAKVRVLTAGSEFLVIEGDKDSGTSVNALLAEE